MATMLATTSFSKATSADGKEITPEAVPITAGIVWYWYFSLLDLIVLLTYLWKAVQAHSHAPLNREVMEH